MISLNTGEISNLQKLGINALILFGSQAQGIANEASDYDLFVIGKKANYIYDKIYEIIEEKVNKLVDIDIVFDEDAPLELKNHVSKFGVVLYQQNDSIFPNFKAKTMIEYADFAPHREIFSNATIARIN